MTATPWGDSDLLRERMLRPGPSGVAAEVADSQRARLFGAMVASVAERGYDGTTVADLGRIAGVSPRSFYRLFPDKQACFVAALRAILDRAAAAGAGLPRQSSRRDEIRQAIITLAAAVTAQPAAARLCLIDAFTVGPQAAGMLQAAVLETERHLHQRLNDEYSGPLFPHELTAAIVEGSLGTIRSLLVDDQVERLPRLAEDLANFLDDIDPPMRTWRVAVRRPQRREEEMEAGDHAERALRAFEALLKERGYAALTMGEVASRAKMSVRTLYANFSGREELMMAAVDSASSQVVATMLPAFRRHENPLEGVRAAFTAFFGLLASRPNLAHLLLVGVREGGASALAQRSRMLRPIEPLLSAGTPVHRRPMAIRVGPEAVLGLAARTLADSGAAALPGLVSISTFIVLAPALGAEQATAAAEGKSYRRSAPDASQRFLRTTAEFANEALWVAFANGASGISEIAEMMLLAPEHVREQVVILEEQGLVEISEAEAPPGEIRVRLDWLQEWTERWAERSRADREAVSLEILQAIQDEVKGALRAGTFDARVDRFLARIPVWLDEQGWDELHSDLNAAFARIFDVQEQAMLRLQAVGDPSRGSFGRVYMVSFEVPGEEGPEDPGRL